MLPPILNNYMNPALSYHMQRLVQKKPKTDSYNRSLKVVESVKSWDISAK
jgi:hypothetical protein